MSNFEVSLQKGFEVFDLPFRAHSMMQDTYHACRTQITTPLNVTFWCEMMKAPISLFSLCQKNFIKIERDSKGIHHSC